MYWGSVLAGTIVVLGLQLMLLFLGNSLNIVPLEPEFGPLAQKTYIYTFVSMLFTNFVGGFTSVSLSATTRSIPAALTALTTWALNSLLGLIVSNSLNPAVQVLTGISWFAYFISWWTFFISFFGSLAALSGGWLALFYKDRSQPMFISAPFDEQQETEAEEEKRSA